MHVCVNSSADKGLDFASLVTRVGSAYLHKLVGHGGTGPRTGEVETDGTLTSQPTLLSVIQVTKRPSFAGHGSACL